MHPFTTVMTVCCMCAECAHDLYYPESKLLVSHLAVSQLLVADVDGERGCRVPRVAVLACATVVEM